jgi:hypothetical protein
VSGGTSLNTNETTTFKTKKMKKTALQQLIDEIDSKHSWFLNHGTIDCPIITLRQKATELLETEREQIEEAYTHGGIDFMNNGHLKASYHKETYQ